MQFAGLKKVNALSDDFVTMTLGPLNRINGALLKIREEIVSELQMAFEFYVSGVDGIVSTL
jgi:hypothetical protein